MAQELFRHFLPTQHGVLVYGLPPGEIPGIARAYGRQVYVCSEAFPPERGRVTYLGREALAQFISTNSEKVLSEAFRGSMVILDAPLSEIGRLLQCTQVKLVLLSPSALLGDPLALVNLLRQNDRLPALTALADAAPYVRFVAPAPRAPHRVYPKSFAPFGGHIVVPNDGVKRTLENIDVYPVRCSAEQAAAYQTALRANEDTPFKQAALMSLTMAYPNGLYGKDGLQSVLDRDYQYLPGAERVFAKLPTYSAKLHAVCAQAAACAGVVLISTKFVEGGAIPAALALEAAGFRRYGGRSFSTTPGNGNFYALLTSADPDPYEGAKVIVTTTNDRTFKNVRQVHVLEPWWHMERMEQLMGRCTGPGSHADLPPHERNIQIFLYVSILPHDEEGYDRHMYRCAEARAVESWRQLAPLRKTLPLPTDPPVQQTLADGQRVDPPPHDVDAWMGAG